MVLERCFCSYKYVYVYYVEIIRYVTHAQKSIIHKVRYLFIRSMYTRPLGLPSRRLLFSSNEYQSRIFKVASYCSTEHLVHVILACVRQNLLPLVFDRRHMVGALKWSRRTFLPVHGILVNTRNSLSKSSAPPLHRRPCSIPWCSNRNESCEHSSKAHSFSHV